MLNLLNPHLGSLGMEVEMDNLKESIQQLLRWGWKYNTNLEEQAAQLHFLTAWTHIVEVDDLSPQGIYILFLPFVVL